MKEMHLIAQRVSLVNQAAEILRDGLRRFLWQDYLPGERSLCATLHVSRPTLRRALNQIEREGWIRAAHGRRRQIVSHGRVLAGPGTSPRSTAVVLLSPLPMEGLRPSVLLWIDELRQCLADAGFHLEVRTDRKAYSQRPAYALGSLIRQQSAACWVLYQSTHAMQNWFSDRGLPAMVVGTSHPDISLPSVDLDYRAACRHAAGLFLAKGHRRIAFFIKETSIAGDLESVRGFQEAFSRSGLSGADPLVVAHDGTVEGVCTRISPLLRLPERPTAFLVDRSTCVLTVLGYLMRRGFRLPEDAALISRENDSFLDFVVPSVARYLGKPVLLARKISRMVTFILGSDVPFERHLRIVPQFMPGDTMP